MNERDEKIAEDSEETDHEPERMSDMSDGAKRLRRQRAYEALLIAKGQLIVLPDEIIH